MTSYFARITLTTLTHLHVYGFNAVGILLANAISASLGLALVPILTVNPGASPNPAEICGAAFSTLATSLESKVVFMAFQVP